MKPFQKLLVLLFFVASIVTVGGCSSDAETSEDVSNDDSSVLIAGPETHSRDGEEGEAGHDKSGEESHGEEGEEDGTEYALTDSYDQVRRGMRLVMSYDKESNSFSGTVENTTDKRIKQVRVEIHLSNGTELGPTPRADLKPGETREVKLIATDDPFDGWTAHPESGTSEH